MAVNACALFIEDNYTKEEKQLTSMANKEMSTKKEKTNTEFYKLNRAKNKMRNAWRRFTTEDAAVADLMADASDNSKILDRWALIANKIKRAMAPISANKEAMKIYGDYKTATSLLYAAKEFGPEGVNKLKEWRQYISMQPNGDYDGFVKYWSGIKEKTEQQIATYDNLRQVQAGMNRIALDSINELKRMDINTYNKLVPNAVHPSEVMAAIDAKIRLAGENKMLKEFYNGTLGIDIDVVLDNPNFTDLINHHVLDMYKAGLMLHNRVVKENINEELLKEIDGITSNVKEITPEYIQKLPSDNQLRKGYMEAVNEFYLNTSNKELLTNAEGKTIFEKMENAMKLISAKKLLEDNKFLMNVKNRGIITQNKELMPNLKSLIDGKNYDPMALHSEIKNLSDITSNDYTLTNSSVNSSTLAMNFIKELKLELNKHIKSNAEEYMVELQQRFPNHTFVTTNGTRILDMNNKIQDIEKNKEILGHVVDLANANLLLDDAITMKLVQDQGAEALRNMVLEGKINLIPKTQADTLSRIKNEVATEVKSFGFRGLNKLFNMSTLFAPWNLPGYIVGTQVWGNIGHTMMAFPEAMRNWPKMFKHIKEAITWEDKIIDGKTKKRMSFDYDKITDEDARKIIELATTSEGSSLLSINMEDFSFLEDPQLAELLNKKELEEGDSQALGKLISKKWYGWMRTGTKIVGLIEAVSRTSMAMEVLNKRKKGKEYIPSTANRERVAHLWGINDHLAAMRVANDTHIDYRNLPPVIKKMGGLFPFVTYKVGSTINMGRQYTNIYKSVKEAMRSGDWKTAKSYLGHGAISTAWRAGIAATLWGTIMVSLGWLSPEKRKKNNEQSNSNIFNSMFKHMGINLDNNIYIPGTGVKPLDSLLRLGKANQKMDAFSDAEALIPGLDEKWRQNGMSGAIQFASGKIASSMSPLIKTPIEMMMGGGTIYETGYQQPKPGTSQAELLSTKMLGFVGLSTVARNAFDYAHGTVNEPRSEAADAVYEWGEKFKDDRDQAAYDARNGVRYAMNRLDAQSTTDAIRAYEHVLANEGKTVRQINDAVRSTLKYNMLSNKVDTHKDMIKSLSQRDRDSLQAAINTQQQFMSSLGYGRI